MPKAITIIVILAVALTDISFASGISQQMLAPPLASRPILEVPNDEYGKPGNETRTRKSVTMKEEFRRGWMMRELGLVLSQSLKLGLSSPAVIDIVREFLYIRSKEHEVLTEEYVFEGIEEVRSGSGTLEGYEIPVERNGHFAYSLRLSFVKEPHSESFTSVNIDGEEKQVFLTKDPQKTNFYRNKTRLQKASGSEKRINEKKRDDAEEPGSPSQFLEEAPEVLHKLIRTSFYEREVLDVIGSSVEDKGLYLENLSKTLSSVLQGEQAEDMGTLCKGILSGGIKMEVPKEAAILIRSFLAVYFFDPPEGKEKIKVSFVIPMFKEQVRISTPEEQEHGEDIVRKKIRQAEEFFSVNPAVEWNLIFVDDGEKHPAKPAESSGEKTLDIISSEYGHLLEDGTVKVLFLDRATKALLGGRKGSGVMYGLRQALNDGADYLIYMDADSSSHPMAQSGELLAPLFKGDKVAAIASRRLRGSVVANRTKKEQFTSSVYNLLVRSILGLKFSDTQTGFKAFSREALQKVIPVDENWNFDTDFIYNFSFDTDLLRRILLAYGDTRENAVVEIPTVWIGSREESTIRFRDPFIMADGLIRQRYRAIIRENLPSWGEYPKKTIKSGGPQDGTTVMEETFDLTKEESPEREAKEDLPASAGKRAEQTSRQERESEIAFGDAEITIPGAEFHKKIALEEGSEDDISAALKKAEETALKLSDQLKWSQSKIDSRVDFIALTRNWIDALVGKHPQEHDLNVLISGIRRNCESAGIKFIEGHADAVKERVREIKKDNNEARGIVVTGADAQQYFDDLFSDLPVSGSFNTIVAGVDTRNLNEGAYLALVEIFEATVVILRQSHYEGFDETVKERLIKHYEKIGLNFQGDRVVVFKLPETQPVDYIDKLRRIYRIQISA